MAITFRAVSSGGAVSTLVTVTKPTGTADGDVLIAVIFGAGDSPAGSPGVPSGWTERAFENSETSFLGKVYTKIAASEPASWDWNPVTSATKVLGWICASYQPTSSLYELAIDQVAANTPAEGDPSTTITAPSVTPTTAADMLVCIFGSRLVGATFSLSAPSGMTERAERRSGSSGTSNDIANLCDQLLASSSATGTRASSAGSAVQANSMGVTIAIKETLIQVTHEGASALALSLAVAATAQHAEAGATALSLSLTGAIDAAQEFNAASALLAELAVAAGSSIEYIGETAVGLALSIIADGHIGVLDGEVALLFALSLATAASREQSAASALALSADMVADAAFELNGAAALALVLTLAATGSLTRYHRAKRPSAGHGAYTMRPQAGYGRMRP